MGLRTDTPRRENRRSRGAMRRTPAAALALLLACGVPASAGVEIVPVEGGGDPTTYEADFFAEYEMLEQDLLEAYTMASLSPVRPDKAKHAWDSFLALDSGRAAAYRDAVRAYDEAIAALDAIQDAVRPGGRPLSERALREGVRRLGRMLNAPRLRGRRQPLSELTLRRVEDAWLRARSAGPQTTPARALPPELRDAVARLDTSLRANAPPAELARRAAALMDGLVARPDLAGIIGQSEYRRAVTLADRAMVRARAAAANHTAAPAVAAAEQSRAALDGRLLAMLRGSGTRAAPAWGQATASFHAVMRLLFPRTADEIWRRFRGVGAAPTDPALSRRYQQAIAAAAPGFQAEFDAIPSHGRMIFGGGGQDGAYWNRVGQGFRRGGDGATQTVDWGAETAARLREEATAARRIPFLPGWAAGSSEQIVMGLLRNTGLVRAAAQAGRIVVPKHFPGGPPDIELTEGRIVDVPGGFSRLLPYLAPFIAIIPRRPEALMVNHASYTDWELRELRPRWGHLATLYRGERGLPASLSPYILRGFLRDALGYQGLIISDWMDMDSVRGFTAEVAPGVSTDLRTLHARSPMGAVFVFAVVAGVNWVTGISHALQGTMMPHLYAYAASPSGGTFRAQLDRLAAETARLRGMRLIAGADAYANFQAKVEMLTRSQTDTARQNWTDIRSRGGVMVLSLRVRILNNLHGTSFPTLSEARAAGMSGDAAEDEWIGRLQADREFQRRYAEVDWDGPEMSQAYARQLEGLLAQQTHQPPAPTRSTRPRP